MSRIKHKGRLVLAAATLTVGAGVAVVVGQFAGASEPGKTISSIADADAAQIALVESTFSTALTADRTVDAPPAATYGQAASAAIAAGQPAPAVADSVRQQQLRTGISTLAKYFTPAQAAHESIGLRNAISEETDPRIRNIGMGVSGVKFVHVSVKGATATLEADVTIWAKSQMLQPNGKWLTANPVNVMDYTATLEQNQTGQWLVSSLVGDFVPGEGP